MSDQLSFSHAGKSLTVLRNGELLFLGQDVCDYLEIKNVSHALSSLDEDEKLVSPLTRAGQRREMLFVTEPGLYRLIFRSNKPAAKDFSRWVAHEVLPELRKTGSYSTAAGPSSPLLAGEGPGVRGLALPAEVGETIPTVHYLDLMHRYIALQERLIATMEKPKRKRTGNNHRIWTSGDTQVALQMDKEGSTVEDIAEKLGRSAYAVEQRLRTHKLCEEEAL